MGEIFLMVYPDFNVLSIIELCSATGNGPGGNANTIMISPTSTIDTPSEKAAVWIVMQNFSNFGLRHHLRLLAIS